MTSGSHAVAVASAAKRSASSFRLGASRRPSAFGLNASPQTATRRPFRSPKRTFQQRKVHRHRFSTGERSSGPGKRPARVLAECAIGVGGELMYGGQEYRRQRGHRGMDRGHLLGRVFVGDQVSQLTNADQLRCLYPASLFCAVDSIEHRATADQLDVIDQAEHALREQVGEAREAAGEGFEALQLLRRPDLLTKQVPAALGRVLEVVAAASCRRASSSRRSSALTGVTRARLLPGPFEGRAGKHPDGYVPSSRRTGGPGQSRAPW